MSYAQEVAVAFVLAIGLLAAFVCAFTLTPVYLASLVTTLVVAACVLP